MTKRTPTPDDDHTRFVELLPFHASGVLDAAEAAQMAQHLAHCAACRDLLAEERALAAAFAARPVLEVPDAAPGLARLLARIDAEASVGTAGTGLARVIPLVAKMQETTPSPRLPYAAAAVLVMTVTLAALSSVRLTPPPNAPVYRTLSSATSPASAVGRINLVLAPERTRADLERLLAGLPVTRVEARAQRGAWQVELEDGAAPRPLLEAAAARLRAQDGVLFAAPVPVRTEGQPR